MQIVPASKYLSAEERKILLQKNDWLAAVSILKEWAWVVFAFALSYFFPNILSYIISIFILGGKQLACAILMHDTSHYALFNNKNTNNFIGQWLGAFPILQDVHEYRPYHIKHHQYNGLKEDPDLLLTRGYPTSRASMIRKFTRDLTGQTAIKITGALFLMKMGYLEYGLGNKLVKTTPTEKGIKAMLLRAWKVFAKPVLANFIIFITLYTLASGWLYLLWLIAFLTTFQFSIRVRSISEHSVVESRTNPLLNTRTTYANFFEKILFAPYHVNYHAEHHMLMGVPPYNFPKMHQLLKQKGFYQQAVLAQSYWETIKRTVVKEA